MPEFLGEDWPAGRTLMHARRLSYRTQQRGVADGCLEAVSCVPSQAQGVRRRRDRKGALREDTRLGRYPPLPYTDHGDPRVFLSLSFILGDDET